MATRPIDQHETRRRNFSQSTESRRYQALTKINKWRDAWTACYRIVQDWPKADYLRFHDVFQQWVPIINWVFGYPIELRHYRFQFHYCTESPGPKEILHYYVGEMQCANRIPIHVVFNVLEFRKILEHYCSDMTRSNRMLVDEDRGTVNTMNFDERDFIEDPAEYFKTMTAWELLFIFTMHAMAHWDAYHSSNSCHYLRHDVVKTSPFYQMHFYGQIVYQRDEE
jgi:hypothetical protein